VQQENGEDGARFPASQGDGGTAIAEHLKGAKDPELHRLSAHATPVRVPLGRAGAQLTTHRKPAVRGRLARKLIASEL
jgi:hypothetical protein